MMKKEVIIGRLTKKTRVIIDIVLGNGFWIGFCWWFYNIFKDMPFFVQTPYATECMVSALIMMWVIHNIFTIPLYGMKQLIVVDDKNLSYYATPGLIQQFQQTLRLLLNQPQVCDLQISLQDIAYITLSYSDIYMGWTQKGHSIIFYITLEDGTLIKLQPDNLYFEKKNCLEGIEFIEKQGIEVKDPYQLKDALKNPYLRFAEYIEQVRRDNHVS